MKRNHLGGLSCGIDGVRLCLVSAGSHQVRFGGGHPQPALFYPTIRVPLRATKVGCRGPLPQFFTPPCRILLRSQEKRITGGSSFQKL